MFYGKWQQLGNSTGILQLEIQLDHLTNFESTVNGTAEIANPLINLDADSSDFKSNVDPFSKRMHQIKNPNLDLLKGTRNPFLDSPKLKEHILNCEWRCIGVLHAKG